MKERLLVSKSRPLRLQDVRIYFNQKGMPVTEAERFYQFNANQQWKDKAGHPVKSWKAVAWRWIAAVTKNQPWLLNPSLH